MCNDIQKTMITFIKILPQHGESQLRLQCDKNENGLVIAVKLDSGNPILYIIVERIL